MEHLYIALARDPETKDDIVFGVRAETSAQVRHLIEKFYREQEWGDPPRHISIESFRSNAKEPMLFVGHANHKYLALKDQVKRLCEKLLEVARWYEGDTGKVEVLDEIRAFVAGFEIGAQVMAEEDKVSPEG